MPKRRIAGTLLVLFLAVLLPGLATLTRVPDDTLAVRRGDFGAGPGRRLEPGWHFRIPIAQAVHRYPAGEIQIEATEELISSEGVSLRVPYRFTARIDPARLDRFDEKARGRDTVVFLRESLRRALAAWASGESAARWSAGEAPVLPDAILDELSALGLTAVSLEVGKAAAPAEVERAGAAAELRRRAGPGGRKILLIGLDGADWQIADPLIQAGKLPNLARLKSHGAWANLKALVPILSPLLWTTAATGREPADHGIVDFLVKDPATGEKVPIASRFRKVPALWSIFTGMGRTVDVVAWWASWPAEPVAGVVVSDRVSYSLFGFQADPDKLPAATYPPEYLAGLRSRLIGDGDVTLPEIRQFADITAVDFQERRAQIAGGEARRAYADPVNHLTRILAATRNYQTATLDLLARGQPDLLMVYFQGIDEVCHRFAHMMPPKMEMVSAEDYARFHRVVEEFYRYQDRLLGEILERAVPDSVVILLSDHGFKNGPARPTDDPPSIEGKPGKWHRLYGIFLMAGPGVKPGALDTVSLLDVAPTVLALSGLPASKEMPGRVLSEAFSTEMARTFPPERVDSYAPFNRAAEQAAVTGSTADAEMVQNLRALGYIGEGGPAGAPAEAGSAAQAGSLSGDTVTYHSNLAALHLKSKKYEEAQKDLDAAFRLVPDYVPALMTQASLYQATQRPERALNVYRRLAESGRAEPGVVSALAGLYEKTGRAPEGIAALGELARRGLPAGEIATGLGKLEEARGDVAVAEMRYRQALAADPGAAEPAARLYDILKKRGTAASLEPLVAKALERNENSVGHQNLMGLIQELKGNLPLAERHLRRAVELDPDYAGVLANLGALLARTGRSDEAIRVLTRAVDKEPGNYEARMNLGAALGKAGRHQEAIVQFEEARRRGFRSPVLFNGLAIAYHETGQIQKCVESLRQSLALDPDQPEVRAMLADVESRKS